MDNATFEFRFDTATVLLRALGVSPSTSRVVVTDTDLDIRFGHWSCHAPLSNVCDVLITRDYSAIKAIGARASSKDRGVTFGTSTVGGVCICFKEPVKALLPIPFNTAVTVTVEDLEGLAALLRERCNLEDD